MNFRSIFFLVGLLSYCGFSQNSDSGHGHDHEHHHRHEIGLAASPVYFVNEKETSFGLHMHYIYSFDHSKFGIGAGYERIFDDHEHQSVGIVVAYRPVDRLTLAWSPGFVFEKHAGHNGFGMHFETAYEFLFGDIHLGPVAEIAFDSEDYHISIGLHVGLGF